jgi:hypothetical protein
MLFNKENPVTSSDKTNSVPGFDKENLIKSFSKILPSTSSPFLIGITFS